MTSALSTEYIHFTANSIALRQFSTQAEGSMGRMRSAETATGAKEENCGMERNVSKLVIGFHLTFITLDLRIWSKS